LFENPLILINSPLKSIKNEKIVAQAWNYVQKSHILFWKNNFFDQNLKKLSHKNAIKSATSKP
jgi:hypothetical protein